MKRALVTLAVSAMIVAAAHAQFFVRGDFNGWGTTTMSNPTSGFWTATLTGLSANQLVEFKVATSNWVTNAPGSNAKAFASSTGTLVVNFWETAPADGWMPVAPGSRVGYDNGNAHGWDIMGDFNSWASPVLSLTGSGVYSGTMSVAAGAHDFKFRKAGDWTVSVGNDFGNSAANINYNFATTGNYKFTLDMPNGRYKIESVPEPATFAALGLGAVAMLRRRKK